MDIVARIERDPQSTRSTSVGGPRGAAVQAARRSPLDPPGAATSTAGMPSELRSRRVYVVVFEVRDREIGLAGAACCKTSEMSQRTLIPTTFRESGRHWIAGASTSGQPGWSTCLSLVAAGAPRVVPRTTRRPWSTETDSGLPPLVLLAEDSGFFRAQVQSNSSRSKGYRCRTTCEDGEIAWKKRSTSNEYDIYDLVLTDIEMPNMNGFDLCRADQGRRRTLRWTLPVIALTSLAGSARTSSGASSVGVDDYQIKMDREKLVASREELLRPRSGQQPQQEATRTRREPRMSTTLAEQRGDGHRRSHPIRNVLRWRPAAGHRHPPRPRDQPPARHELRCPNAPPHVRGVINLRGEVATVIDLRTKIGLQKTEATPSTLET